MKFAENYLSGESLQFCWTRENVRQARLSVAVFLMHISEQRPVVEETSIAQEEEQERLEIEKPASRVRIEKQRPNRNKTKKLIPNNIAPPSEKQSLKDDDVDEKDCIDVTMKTKDDGVDVDHIDKDVQSVNEEITKPEVTTSASDTNNYPRYNLRGLRPKRKRSSFIWTDIKRKKKEIHCVCMKPDDGGKYWCCDSCDRWYHPWCIGKKEEEEDAYFICPSCVKSNLSVTKTTTPEGTYKHERIDDKIALNFYSEALNIVSKVLGCGEQMCQEEDHKRHHAFIEDTFSFIKCERRKFGFGKVYFSNKVLDKVMENLTVDAMYTIPDKNRPITTPPTMMVRNVPKDSQLWKLFHEHRQMAQNYIPSVLYKELLVTIVMLYSLAPYEQCAEVCCSTQKDGRLVFGF